jgi:hypothetical protein
MKVDRLNQIVNTVLAADDINTADGLTRPSADALTGLVACDLIAQSILTLADSLGKLTSVARMLEINSSGKGG